MSMTFLKIILKIKIVKSVGQDGQTLFVLSLVRSSLDTYYVNIPHGSQAYKHNAAIVLKTA